jgi:hypothetical protein
MVVSRSNSSILSAVSQQLPVAPTDFHGSSSITASCTGSMQRHHPLAQRQLQHVQLTGTF